MFFVAQAMGCLRGTMLVFFFYDFFFFPESLLSSFLTNIATYAVSFCFPCDVVVWQFDTQDNEVVHSLLPFS